MRVDQVGRVELVAAVVALVSSRVWVTADGAFALDVAIGKRAAARRVEGAHLLMSHQVALLVKLQKHVLRDAVVVGRRGAREDVVGHTEPDQVVHDRRVVAIDELARWNSLLVRFVGDRCSVLVGAARHKDTRAAEALKACKHVGGHRETDHVADVPRTVRVRPGGSDQDGSSIRHQVDSIGQART